MRRIGDDERRARLARRHGIAPQHRYDSIAAATEAMTALHATEAASVHLALGARVEGITPADVDAALYDQRSLVKQLAMRRTLFAFGIGLLPAALGSAAARVAGQQARSLAKEVGAAGIADDPGRWIEAARAAVLAQLADGVARTAAELRAEVPEIAGMITVGGPDNKWGGEVNIAPRVLTLLGAEGGIVRARNAGHWRLNKPAWCRTESWLGDATDPWSARDGYAELTRRWLWTFGPGTETDLVWWLGATKTIVRRALADVGAVEVALDGADPGWVLPDDVDADTEAVEPWGALLPVLDPTTMGWKQRDFYLDPADVPDLFDGNGNAGTTAWWCGRVVGCWVQDAGGVVSVVLRGDPGAAARAALDVEAARLTDWLDGVVISNVYASRLMNGAPLS